MTLVPVDSDAFHAVAADWKSAIDTALADSLDDSVLRGPRRLADAMRYAVLSGGKRLRPLFTLLAADACGGEVDLAMPAACAVELVHAYSLVHDDLPAMDNDELRRGLPTCHVRFDEATAILAGDALLTRAFEMLAELEPPTVVVECVRILARAAGSAGMVGGQQDDLDASQAQRSLDWLKGMQSRKTGALLLASLEMGAVVARAHDEERIALRRFGQDIGLAFQIADDLLDLEGSVEVTGKRVGKDHEAGKVTYPSLVGIDESRRMAKQLARSAKAALEPLGSNGRRLAVLADLLVERDR